MSNPFKTRLVILGLCGLLVLGLHAFALPVFRTTTIELDGNRFQVEIAETPEQKQRGLQHRVALEAHHGMLFLFDKPQMLSFWMKDCDIPLDILFFNDGQLVEYADSAPPCNQPAFLCPTYSSKVPADLVVELKAGTRKQLKLNTLTKIGFPDFDPRRLP